ncbi:MAG: hypothetical protein WCK63_07065 [Betaproteobacteria bacterium]
MIEIVLPRILHILGIVLWIGGVAMVTTVLLPAIARLKTPVEQIAFFEEIESRFGTQAKFTTLLTGLSGFWLMSKLHIWDRFSLPQYWWMHAMVAVWLVFTLMLFVFEPMFLHRWFQESAKKNPEATFHLIHRLHIFLLSISVITIIGAAAGSHGWLL